MDSVRTVSCLSVRLDVQSHILLGGFSPSKLNKGKRGSKGKYEARSDDYNMV